MTSEQASWDGIERRKFVRVDTRFIVYYKEVALNKSEISFTRNVSGGGILFSTGRLFDADTMLRIRLKLPGSPDMLELLGRVIESHPISEGSIMIETRVEFVNATDEDRQKINQIISTF